MRIMWWWCFAIGLGLGWGCSSSSNMGGTAGTVSLPTMGLAGTASAAPVGTGGQIGSAGSSMVTQPTAGTGVAGTVAMTAGTGAPAAGSGGTMMGAAGTAAGMAGAMAAAGAGGMAGASGGAGGGGGSSAGFPQLPRVTTTDGPGPFTDVVKVMSTPPGGWLIYPKEIGMNGMKHPIFIFGPGAGTGPDTYDAEGHWDRYVSYGFVVYCVGSSTMDGSGTAMALDWTLKQNDDMTSPLYQHLDTSKIAVGGHSLGSIMTFAFLPNDMITTSVHISGGSFDGMGSSHLTKETMFMCGPDGASDLAEPQCEVDYMNAKVPIFYTKLMGATHITSARTGWAATIAWLLWHLAGQEDQWKKEFLQPGGQFETGIYMSESKNW